MDSSMEDAAQHIQSHLKKKKKKKKKKLKKLQNAPNQETINKHSEEEGRAQNKIQNEPTTKSKIDKEEDKKGVKRKQNKQNKSKKKRRKIIQEDEAHSCSLDAFTTIQDTLLATGDGWGKAMPHHILVKIFQMAIYGHIFPTLCNISRVCPLWHHVAGDASLWEDVDLSVKCIRKSKKMLYWLCKNRLHTTRSLNLSGWQCITDADMQELSKYLANLEFIQLSNCPHLTSSTTSYLATRCPQLSGVDLSHSASNYLVSKRSLLNLTEGVQSRLKHLNVSYNILASFDTVFKSVLSNCSGLQELDLSCVIFSTFLLNLDIEKIQQCCPLLEVLRLANSYFKSPDTHMQNSSTGFSKLKELNIARSTARLVDKFRYVTNDVLLRLLRTSCDLKLLDISGCRHITSSSLDQLPVTGLESLDVSLCKAANEPGLVQIILKWSDTLQELDISGTAVSAQHVRKILQECPHLEMLNTSTCRGLPRELRREVRGQDKIMELKNNLGKATDYTLNTFGPQLSKHKLSDMSFIPI